MNNKFSHAAFPIRKAMDHVQAFSPVHGMDFDPLAIVNQVLLHNFHAIYVKYQDT